MRSTRFRGMILLPTGVVMPGMNGAFLNRLLQNIRDLRYSCMSGCSDDAIAHRGILRK